MLPEDSDSSGLIIGLVLGLAGIGTTSAVLIKYYLQKRKKKAQLAAEQDLEANLKKGEAP